MLYNAGAMGVNTTHQLPYEYVSVTLKVNLVPSTDLIIQCPDYTSNNNQPFVSCLYGVICKLYS